MPGYWGAYTRTTLAPPLPPLERAPRRRPRKARRPTPSSPPPAPLPGRFNLAPHLSETDFGHQLLPREGVVDSFVVCDAAGEVTDLCSFYHLPSTVIGNDRHNKLFAAYSFYNVATSVTLKVGVGVAGRGDG